MKKLVLILTVVLLVLVYGRYFAPAPAALGAMPQFHLVKIGGGNINSEDLHGKVLLVDFWASWCEPCKSEIPKYNKLVASMTGKDFQMIGYAVESGTLDEVGKSAGELGIQYPVVMGTDKITEAFGSYRGLPTTFLIGKDGKIYKKYEGTYANKPKDIAKDIADLLAVPYSGPIAQLSK